MNLSRLATILGLCLGLTLLPSATADAESSVPTPGDVEEAFSAIFQTDTGEADAEPALSTDSRLHLAEPKEDSPQECVWEYPCGCRTSTSLCHSACVKIGPSWQCDVFTLQHYNTGNRRTGGWTGQTVTTSSPNHCSSTC